MSIHDSKLRVRRGSRNCGTHLLERGRLVRELVDAWLNDVDVCEVGVSLYKAGNEVGERGAGVLHAHVCTGTHRRSSAQLNGHGRWATFSIARTLKSAPGAEPDGNLVLADGFGYGLNELEGETAAIRDRAAVRVGAFV